MRRGRSVGISQRSSHSQEYKCDRHTRTPLPAMLGVSHLDHDNQVFVLECFEALMRSLRWGSAILDQTQADVDHAAR